MEEMQFALTFKIFGDEGDDFGEGGAVGLLFEISYLVVIVQVFTSGRRR